MTGGFGLRGSVGYGGCVVLVSRLMIDEVVDACVCSDLDLSCVGAVRDCAAQQCQVGCGMGKRVDRRRFGMGRAVNCNNFK